jgi:hypothetical protein
VHARQCSGQWRKLTRRLAARKGQGYRGARRAAPRSRSSAADRCQADRERPGWSSTFRRPPSRSVATARLTSHRCRPADSDRPRIRYQRGKVLDAYRAWLARLSTDWPC